MAKSQHPHSSFITSLIGWLGGTLLKIYGFTLRLSLKDSAGFFENEPAKGQVIWVFWHNRILAMPCAYRRWLRHRPTTVLTSASKDGAVLERVVARFKLASVRGSSSRRGALAMQELKAAIESGADVVITPDGPRGPCYQLAPGPVKLAQLTGAAVYPVVITYAKAWRLRSWDRFFIPKPFSKVTVEIRPRMEIDPLADGESFDQERLRIQAVMGTE